MIKSWNKPLRKWIANLWKSLYSRSATRAFRLAIGAVFKRVTSSRSSQTRKYHAMLSSLTLSEARSSIRHAISVVRFSMMPRCPRSSAATRARWTRQGATSATQSSQIRSADSSSGSTTIRDISLVISNRLITLRPLRSSHRISCSEDAMSVTANSWSVWPSMLAYQPWEMALGAQSSCRFGLRRACCRKRYCIGMKACNSGPWDLSRCSRSSSAWYHASWSYLKISL